MGDGHTAAKHEILDQVTVGELTGTLVRLIYGRDQQELSLHLSPGPTLNASATFITADLLSALELPSANCVFGPRSCAWSIVPEGTSAEAVTEAVATATQLLNTSDWEMRNEAYLQLPKPVTGRQLAPFLSDRTGDGHSAVERKSSQEPQEDELFVYKFSFLKQSTQDEGVFVIHLAPKRDLSPLEFAALGTLGFTPYDDCPEFDFDPCQYCTIANQGGNSRSGSFFDRSRSANAAHKRFEGIQNRLPNWLAAMAEVHYSMLKHLRRPYLDVPGLIESGTTVQRQTIIQAGRPYDGYIAVQNIFAGAQTSLTIVDPYIDESLATMLASLAPSVQIRVISEFPKSGAILALKKLANQRGGLSVKIDSQSRFHDRFLEADGDYYQLGGSIMDLGSRTTSINPVTGKAEVKKLVQEISACWKAAKPAC